MKNMSINNGNNTAFDDSRSHLTGAIEGKDNDG